MSLIQKLKQFFHKEKQNKKEEASSSFINNAQKEQEFLSAMAQKVHPGLKSLGQMEDYVKLQYRGKPVKLSIMQRKALLANVLEQYFPEVPQQGLGGEFSLNGKGNEDPEQQLGLEFVCYQIFGDNIAPGEQDDFVSFERKTGFFSVQYSEKLHRDLILYRGVSEEDIANKTPRFISYAYAKSEEEEERLED